MQSEYDEQWTNYSNTALASVKELGEINARAIEKLSEQQLDLLSTTLDTGIKQLTLMAESKGYKELLSGAATLIAAYNDKLMEAVRKSTNIMTTSKDDLTAWFEKGVETTLAPIKKAAAVKKPAVQV